MVYGVVQERAYVVHEDRVEERGDAFLICERESSLVWDPVLG